MRNFVFSLTKLALYLGVGLATQVFFYADLPSRALYDGSAALSVYAHILGWPLFLLIEFFKFGIWFILAIILAIIVIVAGFVAYMHGMATWERAKQNARVKRRQ